MPYLQSTLYISGEIDWSYIHRIMRRILPWKFVNNYRKLHGLPMNRRRRLKKSRKGL
jgi:hypothetical protein